MDEYLTRNQRPAARRWPAGVCIALGAVAMMLGIGMPGAGWLMGAIALALHCLLAQRTGWRSLTAHLILYALHMFALGPLSMHAGAGRTVAILTLVPAALAGFAIARQARGPCREHGQG